jgi:UDP-glucose 4-epimerase
VPAGRKSMAVCLVIGGAGFLGSHLVEALVADQHTVRVVDNFTTGKIENLALVMDSIEFHPGDYGHPGFDFKVARGVELIFHFGEDADPTGQKDLLGTQQILSAAVQARVRRVVFASTAEVYGHLPERAADESDCPEPVSACGRSRLASELNCALSSEKWGLETVRLRYFNVFGPRQAPGSPYASLIQAVLEAIPAGRAPCFDSDESFEQDLICVDDAVHAALLAARAPRVVGKVFNIARGQPTSWREPVDILNDLLGSRIQPVFTGRRSVHGLNNRANVRRAEVDLGFCAATDLRRTLGRCLASRLRLLSSPSHWLHPPHRSLGVRRSSQME